MNPKTVGEISQSAITVRLLQVGYAVLSPYGDNQRYDLVIEKDGVFNRVQCKTARLRKGALEFKTHSTYAHRGLKPKDYQGQIEYFGVYSPELDSCYLIPIADVPNTSSMKLRVEPSRNGQKSKVRLATKYELRRG